MINYEELIKLARSEGKSFEVIAKEFANALNEASKPMPDPRSEYMAELEDAFVTSVKCETIDTDTAIKGVVMCVADEHPKWDVDAIKQFEEAVTDSIKTHTRLLDCYVNNGNVGEIMLDILGEVIGKSKTKKNSDDEKLDAFLKNLGF